MTSIRDLVIVVIGGRFVIGVDIPPPLEFPHSTGLGHANEQLADVLSGHLGRVGNVSRRHPIAGFLQRLEDLTPLIAAMDLSGLAEDAPAACLSVELDSGLNLLDVATAAIERGPVPVSVKDKHCVGCAGKAERA